MAPAPTTARADAAVYSILSQLPGGRYSASDATWHRSFATLRSEYGSLLPGLRRLEFHRSDGVPPISDELDELLQLMDADVLAPSLHVLVLPESKSATYPLTLGLNHQEAVAARLAALRLHDLLGDALSL
jgi:hypothetical protein